MTTFLSFGIIVMRYNHVGLGVMQIRFMNIHDLVEFISRADDNIHSIVDIEGRNIPITKHDRDTVGIKDRDIITMCVMGNSREGVKLDIHRTRYNKEDGFMVALTERLTISGDVFEEVLMAELHRELLEPHRKDLRWRYEVFLAALSRWLMRSTPHH